MSEMKYTDLKICPACYALNSAGSKRYVDGQDEWYVELSCFRCHGFIVRASGSSELEAYQKAYLKWNNRPTEDALQARVNELEAENAHLQSCVRIKQSESHHLKTDLASTTETMNGLINEAEKYVPYIGDQQEYDLETFEKYTPDYLSKMRQASYLFDPPAGQEIRKLIDYIFDLNVRYAHLKQGATLQWVRHIGQDHEYLPIPGAWIIVRENGIYRTGVVVDGIGYMRFTSRGTLQGCIPAILNIGYEAEWAYLPTPGEEG